MLLLSYPFSDSDEDVKNDFLEDSRSKNERRVHSIERLYQHKKSDKKERRRRTAFTQVRIENLLSSIS